MALQAMAPAKARGADSWKSPAAPRRAPVRTEAAATLRRCACGGSCPRCRGDALRPKLAINTPGDAFEREADRMADAAVSASPASPPSSSAPPALRRCTCGGSCPSCSEKKEEELHREDTGSGGTPGFAPPAVHDVLASPGRPLEAGARGRMEAGFGADFSGVRVHDDARAAESARAVDAHAYTVGSDIAFAAGRYAPGTAAGERLLAHELAHTLQDGAAALRRQPDDDPLGGVILAPSGGPRSLSGSVDFSRASQAEIRAEIAAIRRWLMGRPADATDFDTVHLRSELARLELLVKPAQTTLWDGFAPRFNQEFADVLNVFTVPGAPVPVGVARPAGATGDPLTPAQLQALFTDTQRVKLDDFITSKRIPERLFNGTDKGATTAQQRLLLAAHILANGIYRPGSFDQRVHAQFCFHWVQIVHHYAGATPPGGGFGQGVMGSFDPLGAAVLGTGQALSVWHEKYVRKPDLPTEEEPGGTGPLHEGTRHEEAARKAEEADPAKGARFHRQPSLPIDRFDELQAGDWLWYYNANASEGGGHSVIFSHWEGETLTRKEDGARYRVAVVWSQPTPKRGGVRHRARLGDRFVPNPTNDLDPLVVPITHITRVTPDSAPATTVAELVPTAQGKAATALGTANDAFIRAKEAKRKGTVDRAKLKTWLREQNRGFFMVLDAHLAKTQVKLIQDANRSEELEVLVRLYQRLRALSTNAVILDTNMAAANKRLDAEHAAATAAKAGAERDLGLTDADLRNVASQAGVAEMKRSGLDVQPRIDDLTNAAAELQRQMGRMKAGPDRDEVNEQRQHLLDRADAARGVQRLQAPDLAAVREELKKLAARKQELEAKRAKLLKTRDAVVFPFGLVHPGSHSGEDTRGTTGRLADLDAVIEWDKVMDPAPAAPVTPKKP
jgi:hypothetical protein